MPGGPVTAGEAAGVLARAGAEDRAGSAALRVRPGFGGGIGVDDREPGDRPLPDRGGRRGAGRHVPGQQLPERQRPAEHHLLPAAGRVAVRLAAGPAARAPRGRGRPRRRASARRRRVRRPGGRWAGAVGRAPPVLAADRSPADARRRRPRRRAGPDARRGGAAGAVRAADPALPGRRRQRRAAERTRTVRARRRCAGAREPRHDRDAPRGRAGLRHRRRGRRRLRRAAPAPRPRHDGRGRRARPRRLARRPCRRSHARAEPGVAQPRCPRSGPPRPPHARVHRTRGRAGPRDLRGGRPSPRGPGDLPGRAQPLLPAGGGHHVADRPRPAPPAVPAPPVRRRRVLPARARSRVPAHLLRHGPHRIRLPGARRTDRERDHVRSAARACCDADGRVLARRARARRDRRELVHPGHATPSTPGSMPGRRSARCWCASG